MTPSSSTDSALSGHRLLRSMWLCFFLVLAWPALAQVAVALGRAIRYPTVSQLYREGISTSVIVNKHPKLSARGALGRSRSPSSGRHA